MRYLLLFLIYTGVCFGQYKNVITVNKDYKITFTNNESLIVFTEITNPTVKLTIPSEGKLKSQTFNTGTFISGVALTESIVIIEGEPGVLIIGLDNAVRSKGFGASWTLNRIGRNTWAVAGDLYSLEQNAFVGDDITLRATVNQVATGPFSFVWYKNEQIIPNANFASFKLKNVQTSDIGFYKVKVYNYNKTKEISSETIKLLVR